MQWYYSKGSVQLGPISEPELIAKISSGEISGADMAWREGMADWLAIAKVPELAARLAPTTVVSDSVSAGSPYATPAPYTPAPAPYVNLAPPNSGLAIASMVCGIVGLVSCGYLFPSTIAAVICGHMAMSRISSSPTPLSGRGMAIAGLVCGYVALLFLIFIIIAVALNVPRHP